MAAKAPTPRLIGRPETGPGHYLRDLMYGASDGVVTTFAVVAGVSGAALDASVAVILGVANLVADGFSMGASNYIGLKSELQQTRGDVVQEKPWRHGLATMLAFAVAGAIPLLAYPLADATGGQAFILASILSVMTLALVGALRAPYVFRTRFVSALEMVLIGGVAGLAAYGIGWLAQAFFY